MEVNMTVPERLDIVCYLIELYHMGVYLNDSICHTELSLYVSIHDHSYSNHND